MTATRMSWWTAERGRCPTNGCTRHIFHTGWCWERTWPVTVEHNGVAETFDVVAATLADAETQAHEAAAAAVGAAAARTGRITIGDPR